MREEQLRPLIEKYLDGECSPEETALLESWYAQFHGESRKTLSDDQLREAGAIMRSRIFVNPEKHVRYWGAFRIAAACIIGAILATGSIYLSNKHERAKQVAAEIAPGSNRAILVLDNGEKLALDSAADGRIATQASSDVIKLRNGQIIYHANDPAKKEPGAPAYNSLVVPKGGQYKIVLPDASVVWINSASVLKYPASFAGQKTREVYLMGEAYFEISPDKIHPFIVKSDKQEARVLGTHFDINAYPDNPTIRTTLLEGGLEVKSLVHGDSCRLKPGKQAVLSNVISIQDVDVENVTDWKDGYFIFHEEALDDILLRLSRWYNVEIVCKDGVKKVKLEGIIARNTLLSEVLTMLSRTGKVHFEIRDRIVYASE
ncbi:FecR family protein [Flavitalea sp. BT771]|uniref:FecR family protein n=1 Tax=Flavitalea sp. BT771 TaxID=3063329 RepID=UPI0026E46346|nr:FecR family protein [Flavitalea sp. BT771]MDO6429614.1 FecR family protein [Flavitalea sp. BT771]MDV6218258.1 FecR family protein [Flavitalea sp. BT771]